MKGEASCRRLGQVTRRRTGGGGRGRGGASSTSSTAATGQGREVLAKYLSSLAKARQGSLFCDLVHLIVKQSNKGC